ncbi:MAG TPA: helicase HerA-like domain-containing protein, partial [Anseongella sp.]|nr:helicase HerA-like domain-containing protein [Anseongella sp.]
LIRSKGVGIFFCTQNPDDVPAAVLGQLGMKIQHALRAFTERDRKAIKAAAENYPVSEFYKTSELLTGLGTGEALITVLNEKGIPTPLVHVLLTAPASRMDTITENEVQELVRRSRLAKKYGEVIDRESACELLSKKMEALEQEVLEEQKSREALRQEKKERESPSALERMANSTAGRTVIREVTRGLLGVLGLTGRRRSTRRSNTGLFDLFK